MNPAAATDSDEAQTHTEHDGAIDFERDVEVVLGGLRPALAEILEHISPPVRRASDLRRRVNLGQKVSWGLFTAATTRDAKTIPSLLPGKRGMERFFEATSKKGVPPDVIERARSAFDRFEEAVTRHAGSRDVFETMVAELNGGAEETPSGASDLRHKRSAFRANSLLWGRKAELSCGVRIVGPGADPGLLDGVLINGMVGLQRTRYGVPIQTTERRWRWAMPGGPPEPLDPRETGPQAIGLLHDFCSKPLPEFRLTESHHDYRRYELLSDKLGAAGEVTFFTGEVFRGRPPVTGQQHEVMLFRGVGMPMAMYVGDLLVHRSLCDERAPDVGVYAWPLDGPREFREADVLPLAETSEYLGEGIDAARTPLVPQLSQLVEYAMDRMGWNADEFRVFRCRVEYPLLHTRIKMSLPCHPPSAA